MRKLNGSQEKNESFQVTELSLCIFIENLNSIKTKYCLMKSPLISTLIFAFELLILAFFILKIN